MPDLILTHYTSLRVIWSTPRAHTKGNDVFGVRSVMRKARFRSEVRQ